MEQTGLTACATGLRNSSGGVIEYAEILRDLERLKEISPIDFHEPFGGQTAIAGCTAKNILVCGGNRSGKTEIVAARVLRRCLAKPKQRWWVVGGTFQDSIAIQQAKIYELLPKHQI